MGDQKSGQIDCARVVRDLSGEIEKLQAFLSAKKFEPDEHVRRYALCYAVQCIDFAKALVALQNQESAVSQFAVWRCLFEAYVRFSYLVVSASPEHRVQRLRNLRQEAYNDEVNGVNAEEVDLSPEVKEERRSLLTNFKDDSAKKITVKLMLKELSTNGQTNGWYPLFQMASAKSHSRLTDLERTYGLDGKDLKFPATQSSEECHLLFDTARKFLDQVGCGIAALWEDRASVT